jgi:hypothetical protein
MVCCHMVDCAPWGVGASQRRNVWCHRSPAAKVMVPYRTAPNQMPATTKAIVASSPFVASSPRDVVKNPTTSLK